MKLVVFGPNKRLGGLINNGGIVDLNLAYAEDLKDKNKPRPQKHADATLPPCLQEFLEEGESAVKAARRVLTNAKKKRGDLVCGSSEVKIWAPLPSLATKIICAGANFADHAAGALAARVGRKTTSADIEKVYQLLKEGKHPFWGFWKMPQCVIGPDESMIYPSRTTHLDYEVEVAAIISKRGKDISPDEAMDYVFGYTCLCDWSIRDDPRPAGHAPLSWGLAKNFDSSCSLGPCIVTKDEIPNPHNLQMELRLNGKLRQNVNTNLMLRKFPEWIAHISRNFTLNPGDIFASGTGVGTALDQSIRNEKGRVPTDLFIKIGDVVEIKVEGIGSMKNKVITGI